MSKELAPQYSAPELETRWYKTWEEEGLFTAPGPDDEHSEKGTFVIVIPLPNVTGSLHFGHALNNTLQDILTRKHRMMGYDTLWLPGTDHASIAVHMVIEKQLAKAGTTRFDMGREKFLDFAWEWKEKYGGIIYKQLRRLGSSLDWTRTRFTLDDMMAKAVREAFVRYYEEGLIYRANRIVNWCPSCHTSISDLEVIHEETEGKLWYIRYPGLKKKDKGVVVATTRPETMLGDTAVAVHPEDDRYKGLIGSEVQLPLTGRTIPVIADEHVDPEFGTGAVKITPAHDVNDFEMAQRHNLDALVVFDDYAVMNENAPDQYRGMTTKECRKEVVEDLQVEGYLEKIKPYDLPAALCDRCKTNIEPYVSEQWYLDMKPIVQPAIDVVRNGQVKFVPERWTKVYYNWMENIRDWCISRQLWWGHRIPVWYCNACARENDPKAGIYVSREDITECPDCGGPLRQDEDVLDTWFSSALWPFGTMGWPDDETFDFNHYYPGDVLVTAPDIIFLWVARMIFSSLHFNGKIPFHTVYLHPMIQDHEGRRMSKSLGTGVDPLDLIDNYGADAVRFTLAMLCSHSQAFRLWEDRFDVGRNLTNKMWNAARFIAPHIEGAGGEWNDDDLELSDRWILSRYEAARAEAEHAYASYRFNDLAHGLYAFFWNELCDWYLEAIKPRLYGDNEEAKETAARVVHFAFDGFLRLMHPMMPFITEEMFSILSPGEGYLMVSDWPGERPELKDVKAEEIAELLFDVIRAVRNIRSEMRVKPSADISLKLVADDDSREIIERELPKLFGLARIAYMEFIAEKNRPAQSATGLAGDVTVFVPLAGLIDIDAEKARISKQVKKLEGDIEGLEKKLANENFTSRAPTEVVSREAERLEGLRDKLERAQANLEELQ
ncbi:MAG: valine--tRNA ligase [bacterium]|nr:valine--tRNA ligase [bacterium]